MFGPSAAPRCRISSIVLGGLGGQLGFTSRRHGATSRSRSTPERSVCSATSSMGSAVATESPISVTCCSPSALALPSAPPVVAGRTHATSAATSTGRTPRRKSDFSRSKYVITCTLCRQRFSAVDHENDEPSPRHTVGLPVAPAAHTWRMDVWRREPSEMRMSKGIPRTRANGNGMSAMEGIAGMPSPDEIAAGGNVIPLRHGSPPVEPVQPSPSAATELGPVSPELALIDPELARAARVAAARPTSAGSARRTTRRPSSPVAPLTHRLRPLEPAPRRRRVRLALLASAAGVIALGVLLTLFVGREGRTRPRRAADSIGRARRLPAEGHGHRAEAHNTHARQTGEAGRHVNDACDVGPVPRVRSSRADVRLGRSPGCSCVRVPAVPGRGARLSHARAGSPPRVARPMAAERTPTRASPWKLPLVRVDDFQAHQPAVG